MKLQLLSDMYVTDWNPCPASVCVVVEVFSCTDSDEPNLYTLFFVILLNLGVMQILFPAPAKT